MMMARQVSSPVRIALFFIAIAALAGADPAAAEIINIDVQGDPPNDTVHVGADGVLSTVGTIWNGVQTGVDFVDLEDDLGNTTSVDVEFTSTGGGSTDPSATNDLQDSGTLRTFDVKGLSETDSYDVAVYAAPFSFIRFTDETGGTSVACNGAATYALPGTLGSDYCLFTDRQPVDVGGGELGFTFMPLDGVITGVQISRTNSAAVPIFSLLGQIGLAAGLASVGASYARRQWRR